MEKNPSVSAISKAYSSRVQKEKIKHQQESRLVDIENSHRQENILLAMTSIRTALRDLLSIDFGKRFHLKLIEDDWWGWARVTLKVEDQLDDIQDTPNFTVRVSDHNAQGTLEFIINGDLKTLSINNSGVLAQVPGYLRKIIRNYLDQVTEFVIQNEKAPKKIEKIDLKDAQTDDSNKIDLEYDSNDYTPDTIDTLPVIEDLEKLSGLD